MNIDFNNVRKQALYAMEDLTKELNSSIVRDEQYAKPNDSRFSKCIQGYILIDVESLEKIMFHLRSTLCAIGLTYEEGNEGFKDIYSEIFPEPNTLISFNPDNDEENENT